MSESEFLSCFGAAGPAGDGLRAHYWTLEDIESLAPPEWLIAGLVPRGGKFLTFGPSGHYKSTIAVDMTLAIAHGLPWHGLEVQAVPAAILANEDPRGLAVQHVLGWHRYHDRPPGRVVVIHTNIRLDSRAEVDRVKKIAGEAFPGERPGFLIDTWDRSISGSPDKTEDVNPALDGLQALLDVGSYTGVVSHSPWTDVGRAKGAVTFWAQP
jgi:AAA domain